MPPRRKESPCPATTPDCPPRRTAAVDAFQAGEGALFLISLRAGGFGLNLTGADYVIHLDPWFRLISIPNPFPPNWPLMSVAMVAVCVGVAKCARRGGRAGRDAEGLR